MSAISSNHKGEPATLSQPLTEMTSKGQQLDGMIHALNAWIDEPEHKNLCLGLIQGAADLAPQMLCGLDRADMRFPR